MDGNDIAFAVQMAGQNAEIGIKEIERMLNETAGLICQELSLLRKQIEKLDRTVEKLNTPPDIRVER